MRPAWDVMESKTNTRAVSNHILCAHRITHNTHHIHVTEYEITAGHWPFSVHFSNMANQNIKQDTLE